jgi:hypothetical protein
MNSWEFNKIAGALLGTLLFVMGINMLANRRCLPRQFPKSRASKWPWPIPLRPQVVEEPEEDRAACDAAGRSRGRGWHSLGAQMLVLPCL